MFCPHCGNNVVSTAVVCPKCGSPIKQKIEVSEGMGLWAWLLLMIFLPGIGPLVGIIMGWQYMHRPNEAIQRQGKIMLWVSVSLIALGLLIILGMGGLLFAIS